MAGELEFEQKYILDPRQTDAVVEACQSPDTKIISIRQFYEDSARFRCTSIEGKTVAQREIKKSVKLDAPYSVSLELPPEIITVKEFNKKYEKSEKRLAKLRYQWVSGENQKIMVDFFETIRGRRVIHFKDMIYAIVAEVETILNAETKTLNLELPLPQRLVPFLLRTVDSRNEADMVFKSKNMIDTKEHIKQIEKALEQLYGPAQDTGC